MRAIYSGTFDPITKGHLDIIERASKIFDTIIIAVATSHSKKPIFDISKRREMIDVSTNHLKGIEVVEFNNLLVDFAKEIDAKVIIRGIRNMGDFEYEQSMDYANKSLDSSIETLYLMPTMKYSYISSSLVRTLLEFNGRVEHLVPQKVNKLLESYR
ncbi:Phosphopantetheine adenylyltransferase [hydrothermal vent metagenome]|uniref:Phosphopantetheine adenylyltransferase n=1 Tax=hydrothermal vent metagenome TaxID=652676 RepID=A0A1W1EKG7_9ZZZZ